MRFLKSNIPLYILFVLTSLALLAATGENWQKGAYKTIQSLFFVMFLFEVFTKKKIRLILAILFSIQAFCFSYYSFLYGRIDPGTIYSLLNTNLSESSEFLQTLDFFAALKSLVLACLVLFSMVFVRKKRENRRICYMLPYFLSLLLFVGEGLYKNKKKSTEFIFEKTIKFLGQDVHTRFLSEFFNYHHIQSKYAVDDSLDWENVSRKEGDTEIFFVFIGESARKDSFGLYNPKFNTTPRLEDLKGVTVVNGAFSPAAQTRDSLLRILALNEGKTLKTGLNIVKLAKQAGFKTYWLSNQSIVGRNDTSAAMIGDQADISVFLLKGHYSKAKTDDNLLPFIKNAITEEVSKPKVIFIHTMGSHNSFCARVWKKVEIVNVSSENKCYFNSIHNSFEFIQDVLGYTEQMKLRFKAVYFSDHGLVSSKKSPYFIHGVGKHFSLEAYKVPFIFWDSKKEETVKINRQYFLRDFVHTFAHWLKVEAKEINYTKSVLSNSFKEQKTFVLKSTGELTWPK